MLEYHHYFDKDKKETYYTLWLDDECLLSWIEDGGIMINEDCSCVKNAKHLNFFDDK